MLNQMLSNMTPAELQKLIDNLLHNPDLVDESLRDAARAVMQKRRERIIRNNVRYDQALTQMTDKQANVISKQEGNGYQINQVFWAKNDPYGNVAVMMVKGQVYDDVSGKIKQKIVVVYSDGTFDSTFEKKITMRKVL